MVMIGSEGMISQADTAYNRSQSDLQAEGLVSCIDRHIRIKLPVWLDRQGFLTVGFYEA